MINEVDKNKLSPMMLKYVELKEANPDLIIFYRLGDFYEMFFEDALICSKLLELTLTGKNAGLDERVPMCGIPHHAYVTYVNKLVELGYKLKEKEDIILNTEEKIPDKNLIEERIFAINPLEITPIEALNLIYELRNMKK